MLKDASPEIWLLAMIACAVGPATAALHEAGIMSLGPPATLWPIGFIVVAAATGLGTGLRIGWRVSRMLGAVVAIPNGLVLALYAFLLLFFGFGGSR